MSKQPWELGRHRGKYVLVWRGADGTRHRRSLGTGDESEARLLAPVVWGELNRSGRTDVASLWRAYVAELEGRAIVETMKHTWKAIGPSFGALQGEDITRDHCKAHIAKRRAAGIKDGTIHTELGHLRSTLTWAVKARLIAHAPHILRPSKPRPKEVYFTRQEIARLIRSCETPHIRLFIIVAMATAGRREAILGLTWDRVDFERGTIDLRDPEVERRVKGRALVPMNRTARAALVEAKEAALSPFVIEYHGSRVASVKKGLAAAGKKAGLAGVTHHALRHVAGAHMLEDGLDMEVVSQYLGHSDISVTRKVYARFSVLFLRRAAEALEYDDLALVRSYQGSLRK